MVGPRFEEDTAAARPDTHLTHTDTSLDITMPPIPPQSETSGPKEENNTCNGQERTSVESQHGEESQLVAASSYLKVAISEAKGNAVALQKRIVSDLWGGELPFTLSQFKKVVHDNLEASEQAGYVNRVKLLQFIERKCLVEVDDALKKREEEIAEKESVPVTDFDGNIREGDGSTSYHAPKFIDDLVTQSGSLKDQEGTSLKDMMRIIAPEGFITGFAKGPSTKKLSKTGQIIKETSQTMACRSPLSTTRQMGRRRWAVFNLSNCKRKRR